MKTSFKSKNFVWKLLFSCIITGLFMLSITTLGFSAGEKEEEGKVVDFVILGYSPNTFSLYQEAVEDYEAENPGIDINLQNVSWSIAHEKIFSWVNTGNVPAVSVMGCKWIPELLTLDGLEPLDDHFSDEFLSNFPKSLLDALRFDGKLYALPEALSTRLMYYRKDIFDKAGITKPATTWSQWVKDLQSLDLPPNMYGFVLQGKEDEAIWMYHYFVLGAGGYWVNDQGEWEVNSPECVEALQFEVDITHKYKITQPDPGASGMDTIQGIFSEGKCVTYWGPPWTLGQIRDSHPELLDDIWVTDYPTKSGKPAPMYIQDAFVMYKGAKHLNEAAKFIEFWSQDKYQVKFNKTESLIPVTISAGQDSYFQENPFLSRFVESIPKSKTYPFKVGWETVNVEVRSAVQRALLKQQTPKEALDEAQRKIMAEIK